MQGGGQWVVRVSRVYLNALVSFLGMLVISRPFTQPTLGIMWIKEWEWMTLASHSHTSINTLGWCACLLCLAYSHVWLCRRKFLLVMQVLFTELWVKVREKCVHTYKLPSRAWKWKKHSILLYFLMLLDECIVFCGMLVLLWHQVTQVNNWDWKITWKRTSMFTQTLLTRSPGCSREKIIRPSIIW